MNAMKAVGWRGNPRPLDQSVRHQPLLRTGLDDAASSLEFRRTSRLKLFGLPLYDVWYGRDPVNPSRAATAKGVLAVGTRAKGVIAMGQFAYGFLTFGVFSIGIVAFGVITMGLLTAGVVGLALVAATGCCSLAPYAFGVVAVGWTASGVVAHGSYVLDTMQTLKIAFAPLLILVPFGVFVKWLPIILSAKSQAKRLVFIRGTLFLIMANTGAMVGSLDSSVWHIGSPLSLLIVLPATLGLYGLAAMLDLRLDRLSKGSP